MLKRDDVEAEEERLRAIARELPDETRKLFFRDVVRQLKDPDTYAVLNWFFLIGLHHFYLGRWGRGFADLGGFVLGIILLVMQLTVPGTVIILTILAVELWALFRSQLIIQDWNNRVYRELLQRYGAQVNSEPNPAGSSRQGQRVL